MLPIVPSYMPWRLFWAYFFGFALLAASLSIATKIQVRWSGLLFGVAMFSFVAMLMIPGVIASPRDRFAWTLVFRESSFGGGGWMLAGNALREQGRGKSGSRLITVGRLLVGIAATFYGVEHFLHPANVPGVPLEKLMPAWIPGHLLISYLTGAILLVAGTSIVLGKKTRMAATYLGTWMVLLVLFIYGPILIASLGNPGTDIKVEGINYFLTRCCLAERFLRSPARCLAQSKKLSTATKLWEWCGWKIAVPQRLKPNSNNALTAALKRCATQEQAPDRVSSQPVKPWPTQQHRLCGEDPAV